MVNWEIILVAGVVFLAVFTQSVVGFGLALISMPLLVGLLGIRIAAPLVALIGILSQVIMLLYYRQALRVSAIKQLAIGSVMGIPLGVLALRHVDEALITALLGVIVMAYAAYGLLSPHPPTIERTAWGYGWGFVGGVLSGAYNIGGPPLIIYGSARGWEPQQFKGNLQALFFLHSLTVLAAHAIGNNLTPVVLRRFLYAAPAVILALVTGLLLDRYITSGAFRRIVLVMLILMGLNLLFQTFT